MALYVQLGTRKGLITARKATNGWRIDDKIPFLGQPVPMTLHDSRSGFEYAAINLGHFGQKLHRSKDGGATWQEITVPAFPPKPADAAEVLCAMRKVPVPWNVEMIWCLETGAAEGQLWCGTIPGALFLSRDHGDSWQLVESLWNLPQRAKWLGGGYDWPGIHSISVDPRNPRGLMLAISTGGVWATNDDGATWENRAKGMFAAYMPPESAYDVDVQDIHRMVRCPAAPDTLWGQHHNGIFRTTNNGAQWAEIKNAQPSNFGFAVAVHPKNPDIAWFVPAIKDELRIPVDGRVVVSRTGDGGKTFEVLRSGLPDTSACHLVYRHCLEVDSTGNVLAMGSTTGSFWISENSGDHWQRVSPDLPPIYSVRIIE